MFENISANLISHVIVVGLTAVVGWFLVWEKRYKKIEADIRKSAKNSEHNTRVLQEISEQLVASGKARDENRANFAKQLEAISARDAERHAAILQRYDESDARAAKQFAEIARARQEAAKEQTTLSERHEERMAALQREHTENNAQLAEQLTTLGTALAEDRANFAKQLAVLQREHAENNAQLAEQLAAIQQESKEFAKERVAMFERHTEWLLTMQQRHEDSNARFAKELADIREVSAAQQAKFTKELADISKGHSQWMVTMAQKHAENNAAFAKQLADIRETGTAQNTTFTKELADIREDSEVRNTALAKQLDRVAEVTSEAIKAVKELRTG